MYIINSRVEQFLALLEVEHTTAYLADYTSYFEFIACDKITAFVHFWLP